MERNMNVNCIDMIRDFLLEDDTKDNNVILNVDEHVDIKDMLKKFPYHCVSDIVVDVDALKYLSKSTTYMDSDLAPKQIYGCLRKSQQ